MPNILSRLDQAANTNPAEALSLLPELMQAYHDGLIIEVPCEVGDTVYSIQTGFISSEIITGFETRSGKLCALADHCIILKLSDFDKSVFLTREAAEKKLEAKL